jgi:hypothetical protein
MHEERTFWQRIRVLAQDLREEGDSDYERAIALAHDLDLISESGRDDCLDDLDVVVATLTDLHGLRPNRVRPSSVRPKTILEAVASAEEANVGDRE